MLKGHNYDKMNTISDHYLDGFLFIREEFNKKNLEFSRFSGLGKVHFPDLKKIENKL